MDVTPLIPKGRSIIQSYRAGGFKISGVDYAGAVLVFPGRVTAWNAPSFSELSADFFLSLDGVRDADVLLVGTGAAGRLLPPEIRRGFKDSGLAPECMATDAACRTFNVLIAEGRDVVAALLPFA